MALIELRVFLRSGNFRIKCAISLAAAASIALVGDRSWANNVESIDAASQFTF